MSSDGVKYFDVYFERGQPVHGHRALRAVYRRPRPDVPIDLGRVLATGFHVGWCSVPQSPALRRVLVRVVCHQALVHQYAMDAADDSDTGLPLTRGSATRLVLFPLPSTDLPPSPAVLDARADAWFAARTGQFAPFARFIMGMRAPPPAWSSPPLQLLAASLTPEALSPIVGHARPRLK